MTERQFRPIEEFGGFGEGTSIDQVVDAILEFGPDVMAGKDVFFQSVYGIQMSARAHLLSLALSWSARDSKDPELSKKHEARNILFDRAA